MNKMIICFGDSNTYGYKSSDMTRFTEEERWPCMLKKLLGSSYYIAEEGLSGRTTVFDDPLFEGRSGLKAILPCLLTHSPVDLLIIMLGTNDTKARFSASAKNISRGLERLTQKAISVTDAWRTKPNILLIAPAPIDAGYTNTDVGNEMGNGCCEKSRILAPLYQDVAASLNCYFLDAGAIKGIHMDPADYMHLDKKSHAILANMLASAIPEMIGLP